MLPINKQFMNVCLPTNCPVLNPTEEYLPSWQWKVYDQQPYTRGNVLQATELACSDIYVESCQGWIQQVLQLGWLARENVAFDVDEAL